MVYKPVLESKQNKIQCRSKIPRFSTNSQTAEKKNKKPTQALLGKPTAEKLTNQK
jgi:hypothetical protein